MIDLQKRYKTRRGGEVLAVVQDGEWLRVLEKFQGCIYAWSLRLDGRSVPNSESSLDLIEVRKARRWTLTETGEEPRPLRVGERAMNRETQTLVYGPTLGEYTPASFVESEVEL